MIPPLRLLGLVAALSVPVLAARAESVPRPANAAPAERSADEAMYDARYGMGPRGGVGQGALERTGATGGGGQQN